MKEAMTLDQTMAEVERIAASKLDFVADSRKLNVVVDESGAKPELRLEALELKKDFGINKLARRQLAEWSGIPTKYQERMFNEAPDLLAHNANHWLQDKAKERLVRTLDDNTRAFLSNRFRMIDNPQVLRAVIPTIQKAHPDLQVMSCKVDENQMFLKAVFPRTQVPIVAKDHPWVENREVQQGIFLKNSEVGEGRYTVCPLAYDLACLNGLVYWKEGQNKVHVGGVLDDGVQYTDDTRQKGDDFLLAQLTDVAKYALDEGKMQIALANMERAIDSPEVKSPAAAIKILATDIGTSNREDEMLLDLFTTDRSLPLNQYGLQAAVTALAKDDSVNYERAQELEIAGANLITLDPTEWERFASAA